MTPTAVYNGKGGADQDAVPIKVFELREIQKKEDKGAEGGEDH